MDAIYMDIFAHGHPVSIELIFGLVWLSALLNGGAHPAKSICHRMFETVKTVNRVTGIRTIPVEIIDDDDAKPCLF